MTYRAHLTLSVTVSLFIVAAAPADKLERSELDALMAETDAIARKVAALRGLTIKKPIARGIMSKDEVTRRLLERIDEEYAPAELAEEERSAKRLGLMAPDADYKGIVVKLLTEQIAGFYDPTVKELHIADWVGASEQRIVMAHEIDHALQDQTFDLVRFTRPIKDNADEQLARQALVEGDGVALMIEFMFQEMGLKVDPWADDTMVRQMAQATVSMAGFEEFKRAPLFMRESLMFPYTGGLGLIAFARRLHPWSRVDGMYTKPPVSTEQVLHPEKYFGAEKPVALKIQSLPSLKGWKPVYRGVLGELLWSIVLRQNGVAEAQARLAAAGWGGDRYAVYAPPDDDGKQIDRLVLLCMSAWDAEADAVEAYEATLDALRELTSTESPREEKKGDHAVWTDANGAAAFVERRGARVAFGVGVPDDKATKLRGEIWAKWRP